MRDIYKNPMLYYLLLPVLVAIWPLLVRAMYLPRAEQSKQEEKDLCVTGQAAILDILKYDPDRLTFTTDDGVSGTFSYANAIDRVANMCGIRSTSCNYSAGSIMKTGGKKMQNAKVSLKDVGIVQAAMFLSHMQSMWATLKCDKIKLTKKEDLPDQWNVEMNFWYTY